MLRLLATVTSIGAFLYMALHTLHWPLMQDAAVMHYINVLMSHGFAPYRQIGDFNMPGAYMMDRLGMIIFGPSDLGFRIYDLVLTLVAVAGSITIAKPYDWLAGLCAGVLLGTIHAADGPKGAGQRDYIMAVLIIAGIALLFSAVRSRLPVWTVGSGFFFGLATSVKPTVAPLGLLLLAIACFESRKRGLRAWEVFVYGLIGAAIPALIIVGCLLYYHSLHAFLFSVFGGAAAYADQNRQPFLALLRECIPRPMRLLVPFAFVSVFVNRDYRNWERWALFIAVGFSAFSYFIQGKGFYYHRYPLIATLLIWFAIELTIALRHTGIPRMAAAVGLAIGIFGLTPLYAERSRTKFYSNVFTETLERELRMLGVNQLQHRVECMDMVDGCMNALYHLDIVQWDGMTGDNVLFSRYSSPEVEANRQLYWKAILANPPLAFVISDEQFLDPPGFDKLDHWPQFRQYLADHYVLYTAHHFPITVAYRIYVRKR